jgi:pyruvate ferredoxin oxidoreductase delta subunit
MAKERKKIDFNKLDELPPMVMSLRSMAANPTGSWRNLKPVIDPSQCIQCTICWKFCPDDNPVINLDFCKGCGICAEECPKKCIQMVKEGK